MVLDDYDYVLVEAPTGYGKSLINIQTVLQKLQEGWTNAYITTPAIGLMDVYRDEFDLTEIKGRNNYTCLHEPKYNCDYGICKRIPKGIRFCKKEGACLYKQAVKEASGRNIVLSNPAYLIKYMRCEGPDFTQRDIAVFDEGHSLDKIISSQLETTLTKMDFQLINNKPVLIKNTTFDFWKDYIGELKESLGAKMSDVKSELDSGGDFEQLDLSHQYFKYQMVKDKLGIVDHVVSNKQWGMIEEVYGRRHRKMVGLKFSPISVAGLAKNFLKKCGKKVIISSATLLGGDIPASNLGLKSDEYVYIRVTKSPFPKENRPIININAGRMSYANRKKSLPMVIELSKEIISQHKGEKGLIVPPSFWLAKHLYTGLNNIGIPLYYHEEDKEERFNAIQRYKEHDGGAILISTYVKEGYDFADDLGRFIIVPKIPFPAMDKKVKKRMRVSQANWQKNNECSPQLDKEEICQNFQCGRPCQKWYRYEALTTLVQMLGRIVRHEKDWGRMYVLDSGFKRFISSCGAIVPEWFKEAIV